MQWIRFSFDNPNYFDIDSLPSPTESQTRSSGIFTFRKRTSSSQKHPQSPATIGVYNNIDNTNVGKRRGSIKNLWRSRSNSASVNYPKDSKIQNQACRNVPTTPTNPVINFHQHLEIHNESQHDETDDVFYARSSDHKFFHSMSQNIDDDERHRRHSVGTFASKDKISTTSFIDEPPLEEAPRAPTHHQKRIPYQRDQSVLSASACANMDDILIVTAKNSELGILWVNYLRACFDKITKQRGRMSFNFLHIKIDDDKFDSDLIQRCHTTKLQIVIICPLLINLEFGMVKSRLSQILKSDRTIGMLLDVKEVQMLDIHRDIFPSYNKWRKCVIRDHDQSFVSNFLGIAQDILGRALRQRPLATEAANVNHTTHRNGVSNTIVSGKNHDNFTVIPKKMKIGQNKATVMLTEPLDRDDFVKVKIEKIGHTLDITNIKRRNPYTFHFTVPESCMEISMMIGIRVYKNNTDLGVRPIKCESRLRELEQILKSSEAPMDFMCQALGISSADNEKLDLYVVQSFQKNIPPNFHLLSSVNDTSSTLRLHSDANPEEYPTLMHFAARFGLERLGLLLLECPGAETACELRNLAGKTPADIAELHGHFKLSNSFKNFSKMNEFTTMYHYFKGISETADDKSVVEIQAVTVKEHHLPPTEECTNDSYPTHYLEMKSINGSDGNNNDIKLTDINESHGIAVANLSYLNLDNDILEFDSIDVVDGPAIEMKPLKKRDSKDLINNLNNMKIKEEDEKEITNELKITEENYYESNEQNKVADDFSNVCSDALESTSQTETISLTQSTNSIPSSNSDNQQQSFQFSDYLIQPSNRPVTNAFGDYLTHPSNRPVEHEAFMHDYMNQSIESEDKIESSHLRLYFKKKTPSMTSDKNINGRELASPTKSHKSTGTLKRNDSDASSKKSVDDELLEIINDFKNNVFTIQEVEELVATWKNRNDVKKSFKEKQEQLQKMREEYEKIQQNMKDRLKRPSPFERMKRLFIRKHDKTPMMDFSLPINLTGNPNFSTLPNSNQRPNSTLSLHSASSNSSGRMSTSSQVSVGDRDSGTHSDHEDRRNHHLNSFKSIQNGSLMENYLIPPAPRPILTPLSTPVDEKCSLSSFSLSQNVATTSSAEVANEHYILFPSNVPVFSPTIKKPNENTFITFKGNK
ncbi:hypothetical protein ACKWTF_005409 [Chironomus riparius]